MNWPSICAAVAPCLNEAENIQPLLAALSRHLTALVVVDDGSNDTTPQRAREAGAEVLRHERSLGKGAALQTGWRHARANGFKWALSLDGDGQHSPEDIPAFFEC